MARPDWMNVAARLAADHLDDGDSATAIRINNAVTARIDAEIEQQRGQQDDKS